MLSEHSVPRWLDDRLVRRAVLHTGHLEATGQRGEPHPTPRPSDQARFGGRVWARRRGDPELLGDGPSCSHICTGHDCSLRLWSLDNKTCVQEITAHRKKHEEAIHAVACHPSKALIASAGADALAKVFV